MNLPISSIQDEVEKDCKVIRAAKHAKTKKTFEKFLAIQKDLQQTISEVRSNKENRGQFHQHLHPTFTQVHHFFGSEFQRA